MDPSLVLFNNRSIPSTNKKKQPLFWHLKLFLFGLLRCIEFKENNVSIFYRVISPLLSVFSCSL